MTREVFGINRIAFLTGLLLSMLWAVPAHAHWADQAVAAIVVDKVQTRVTLTFPTGLVGFADDNRDGQLSVDEMRAHREEIETFLGERIRLADGQRRGVLNVAPAAAATVISTANLAPATHTTLILSYAWPSPIASLMMRYDLFVPGISTASCLATILQDGQVRSVVFTPEHRSISLTLARGFSVRQSAGFVALGIRHILSGYDHLLFLFSLLMLGGQLRQLVKIVTAFTMAHSITLSLAVLHVVALPTRWVESAIALSIVYVAAENFWRRSVTLRRRWLVTFGFGLVHGLGFASILLELNLPRSTLAGSLVGFNLGVEMGQVAVVAIAFLVLQLLRRWPWELIFRRWVSAGAVAAGLIWFVQRALLGS